MAHPDLTATTEELALWLAGLTEPCDAGHPLTDAYFAELGECYKCDGVNKVPVLPWLREPCPCPSYCVRYRDFPDDQDWRMCRACGIRQRPGEPYGDLGHHGYWCENCQGRNWVPEQGREVVQDAMVKDGWTLEITEHPATLACTENQERQICTEHRNVLFYRFDRGREMSGEDSDDWRAAVKAMKAAGYG